jgi:NADPH:quinone reductase-like Zn-dependent oxidoreductase
LTLFVADCWAIGRHVMKAIRVEKQGGPEVLELLDVAPLEAPGPGQAVVRVVAAGVNFLDVGQRRGTYPRQVPFTLGWKARAWLNPLAKASEA